MPVFVPGPSVVTFLMSICMRQPGHPSIGQAAAGVERIFLRVPNRYMDPIPIACSRRTEKSIHEVRLQAKHRLCPTHFLWAKPTAMDSVHDASGMLSAPQKRKTPRPDFREEDLAGVEIRAAASGDGGTG